MKSVVLLDCAGRRRSPATTSSFHEGLPPRKQGPALPAVDPPRVEEIVAVMHAAGDSAEGIRLRGIVVVLWRAGLRISEALALAETVNRAGFDGGSGVLSASQDLIGLAGSVEALLSCS